MLRVPCVMCCDFVHLWLLPCILTHDTEPRQLSEMSGVVANVKSGVNNAVKDSRLTLSGAVGILGLIVVLARCPSRVHAREK